MSSTRSVERRGVEDRRVPVVERRDDSDTLYRQLFTLAPSGVVVVDAEGRILEFNERACEQLGYSRDEFARMSIADLDVDETPSEIRSKFQALEAKGQLEFEVRHRTRSGGVRNVLVKSRPVEIGGERRFLAVWQDITEWKRTQLALRQTEAMLRTFSDSIPDPVFMKDRESRFLFANPAALAVLGKSLEEVLGRDDTEIYADRGTGEALVANDRRIMATGVAVAIEERIETAAGPRVFLSTKVPYRDAAGRVIGIIGNAHDITDRKETERRLEERERHVRTILRTALDGFYLVDLRGRIVEVNDAYCAMSGYDREELLQLSIADLEAAESPEQVAAHIRLIIRKGGDRFETRHRRKDGRIIEVENSIKFVDLDGGRFVCFARDITDRKRAEEQARQAQRIESVGRLAGGIAHDFNNLLTVILSCADALRDEVHGTSLAREAVEDIRIAGTRASDLTRQLLAFSRRQVVSPVPLSLNRIVQGTEKLLRRVLGEDVELTCSLQPDLWIARCDPGQMEQVLMNLAVNARDAMPRGGTLTLETRNAKGKTAVGGDEVVLSVRDSGVGMGPEVKAHLFEPFFTTKPHGVGTGLGLATVYGIVKQSNGHIQVESEPGRGTIVEMRFPRVAEEAVSEPPPPSAVCGRGTETVLVIEDDVLVRGVTLRALRSGGYRVLVAGSGAEALRLPAEELRRTSLVITDVVMPGMGGRATADELQRRHPRLRVLFVSGYSEDSIAQHGVLERGIEFLPKPFSPQGLLARVRELLDRP